MRYGNRRNGCVVNSRHMSIKVLFCRITDFNGNGILREDTFKSLPFDKAEGYYLKEGDVLFARSGATVGKSFIFNNYKGRACFAGYLIKASPNLHKLLPDFLYYYTQSSAYDIWCSSIFTQATIQNISATKYAYLPIPLPTITIQQSIASYLDKTCAAIENPSKPNRNSLKSWMLCASRLSTRPSHVDWMIQWS